MFITANDKAALLDNLAGVAAGCIKIAAFRLLRPISAIS